MHKFRGVYTALITPFSDIGTVDYQSLERIVEEQIASGIDGLVPCGEYFFFRLSGHRLGHHCFQRHMLLQVLYVILEMNLLV